MILLLQLVACTLSCPGLDKRWVELKSLIRIGHSSHGLHQLDVSESAIAVDEFVVRVALDALIEFFDCVWEVTIFEKLVSAVLVLLSFLRVNVG